MSESSEALPKPQIKREEVENAYKIFLERGIKNPDNVTLEPGGDAANQLYTEWVSQQMDTLPLGSEERLTKDLEVSTFYVDVGFSDPDYLSEVANDWLVNTQDEAEANGYKELVAKIEAKINDINSNLETQIEKAL